MNCLLLMFFLGVVLSETARAAPRGCVILIHGLGRTPLSMLPLQWTLRRAGYRVVNLRYPSRRFNVERLAEDYLDKAITTENRAGATRIHFVTHSLGGIILRQYLAGHTMTNLGRVVMLAPPNHGSELADRLQQNAAGRWILGPAGCQLGTGASGLPEKLGPAQFPMGVIAAVNDGKVSIPSAQLDGMADFLVVPGRHTWIMWRRETSRQVLAFLERGHFLLCGGGGPGGWLNLD